MAKSELLSLRASLDSRTRLDHTALQHGPSSIETDEEVARATPEIVSIVEASQSSYDAVVIACVGDAGVASAREKSRIPVIGPGEAAMQLASIYGPRFSIVVATPNGVTEMTRLANAVGLGERLASVRSLGIPIAEVADDLFRTQAALVREAHLAASADGARAVIIGCGAAAPTWSGAQRSLSHTQPGVRLIEPLSWAVRLAEALVRSESVTLQRDALVQAGGRL